VVRSGKLFSPTILSQWKSSIITFIYIHTRTGTPKNSAWFFLINSFDNPEAKVGEN
jgi:hypothetical protein